MAFFDVLVVGGGPAGLACALTLRRHGKRSVAVVERTDYAAPRIGETLSPGVRGTLEYLGVWESFAADGHRRAFGTAAAWGSSTLATRDFILTPFGTAWHLDRQRFDATLAQEAEAAGVVVFREAQVTVRPFDGGWQVQLLGADCIGELTAPILVDATGKAATASRRAGARHLVLDRMVAITATVELPAGLEDDAVTLVETFGEGWWYSARLPGSEIVVALMTDPDQVRKHNWTDPARWWSLLGEQPHHAARFEGTDGLQISRPRVFPAFSSCLNPIAGENWLAIGDAACSQDPLSGSGIARALDTGIHAARAIDARLRSGKPNALTAYAIWVAEGFTQYWTKRLAYYAMERRWPESAFWRRRQPNLTLQPHDRVAVSGDIAELQPMETGWHSMIDNALLTRLCENSASAYEIVRCYSAQATVSVPEIEIILALQRRLQLNVASG